MTTLGDMPATVTSIPDSNSMEQAGAPSNYAHGAPSAYADQRRLQIPLSVFGF
jgi:hypothetical protein